MNDLKQKIQAAVNLYKSGNTGTAGANDFYIAEGIYLLCISGGC